MKTRLPAMLALVVLALVRMADANAPVGRYVIANGTLYDTLTKLTWQQVSATTLYSQAAARTYCAGLALDGGGWRLPTAKEYVTIMDMSSSTLIDSAFQGPFDQAYWSSTTGSSGSGYRITFDIHSTPIAYAPDTGSQYARCVR